MFLTVKGRVAADSSGQFGQMVRQSIDEGQQPVVIDLESVDYISSAGAQVLADAARHLKPTGRRLHLCNLQEPVRVVLDMSGLLDEVTVFASRQAALEALR